MRAMGIVLAIVGVMSLCAIPAGRSLSMLGALFVNVNPINLTFANIYPDLAIPSALSGGLASTRIYLIIGSLVIASLYGLFVYLLHSHIKRTFMMTVRRLAGAN